MSAYVVEPRYVEVLVRRTEREEGPYDRRLAVETVYARAAEERYAWAGSRSEPIGAWSPRALVRAALSELARATERVRPSWVRDDYDLEVLVVGAHEHAVSGRGATLGDAIDDAIMTLCALPCEEASA